MLKKILFIHHGKGLGGAPLSLLYLIEGLDKTRYQPVVLFLHDSDAMDMYRQRGIAIEGPVNLYDFSHTKIWWLRWYHAHHICRNFWHTFKTWSRVADCWYTKIKPDIVHLNTSSLVAWGAVAKKKGIPVVWHIREPLADGYIGLRKQFIKKCVEKYSDAIVAICKNDSKPWELLPKTHVVYNAVDDKFFDHKISNLNKNVSNDLAILFLGGLSEEKGTLVILRALEKLLQSLPKAKLLIAGYFDLSQIDSFGIKKFFPAHKFKTEVKTILEKVKNNVIFLGPIKNVPQAMASSDVLVFPATVGHFARPVIEAGFMKKPVIASNISPLDELIIDGKTGFLVDPNQTDLWSQKLYLLLTSNQLASDFGQNAYDYCCQKFHISQNVKSVQNIYDQLMQVPRLR